MEKKIVNFGPDPPTPTQNLKLIKWDFQAQIHSNIQSQNIFLNQNFWNSKIEIFKSQSKSIPIEIHSFSKSIQRLDIIDSKSSLILLFI